MDKSNRLFKTHRLHNTSTIVVRGSARRSGATFTASNLAYRLAQSNKRVLLMDFTIWNNDLSARFGAISNRGLPELARQHRLSGTLETDTVQSLTIPAHSTCELRLLSNAKDWIVFPEFQGAVGWDFVHAILESILSEYDWIVIDIGAHQAQDDIQDWNKFSPACTIHLGLLNIAHKIINVFPPYGAVRSWIYSGFIPKSITPKEIFVINKRTWFDVFTDFLTPYPHNLPMCSLPDAHSAQIRQGTGFMLEVVERNGSASYIEKKLQKGFDCLYRLVTM
ncbi:hypothetical protein D6779_09055 [Candidatus Parcubacteria bacterium]|nr:MAG: hypothetical protein D6779_09055 [Candidatus Parcubacteria bacterium]